MSPFLPFTLVSLPVCFPIHWTQFIEVPSVALALLAALHVGSCSPALLGSGGRGREKKKNIVTPRLLLLGVGCLPGRRGCGPNRALCHVGWTLASSSSSTGISAGRGTTCFESGRVDPTAGPRRVFLARPVRAAHVRSTIWPENQTTDATSQSSPRSTQYRERAVRADDPEATMATEFG